MTVIRIRPSAEGDAAEIWDYIAEDSEAAADRMLELIDAQFTRLARFPNMGRERPELADGLRSFPVGRYVVFYLPVTNGIEVVRVLHASRDVQPDQFDDE